MDETVNISFSMICSKMHRFRCSADEPTCLSVTAFGNGEDDCKNKFDELWLGMNTKLSDINCNQMSKDQCEMLREFINNSWRLDNLNEITKKLTISFRYYCDTFWNLASKEDENVNECRQWWECRAEQWRCNTGQCIEGSWVLDGEWDCRDGSDEEDISDQLITVRNLEIVPLSILINRLIERRESIPFSTICNLTIEFPCLPINFSNPLINLTHHRPCINQHRIADGHIDCYGAIDERNTITLCNQPTMLGYNYKCMSTDECIPYWNHCTRDGDRCSIRTDDEFWCDYRKLSSICYDFKDAICFNGTCVKDGRCDRSFDCHFGEDEYMCDSQDYSKLTYVPYRRDKEITVKNTMQKLRLIRFPTDSIVTEVLTNSASSKSTVMSSLNDTEPIAYWCNRGVGIRMHNGSIACFCPPQYFGDKCEFHSDRITILLHLNISQSIYANINNTEIVLKILILFLFNN
jgi:hypothetical protein